MFGLRCAKEVQPDNSTELSARLDANRLAGIDSSTGLLITTEFKLGRPMKVLAEIDRSTGDLMETYDMWYAPARTPPCKDSRGLLSKLNIETAVFPERRPIGSVWMLLLLR